jgi:hypothetical protein
MTGIEKKRICRYAALFFAAFVCISGVSGQEAAVRRYGIFVGANDGGRERVLLRYAESDAASVASVLQRLGGLEWEDTILLKGASKEEIKQGIEALQARISSSKTAGKREEFIFYYSGHSDETGLLLGSQKFDYLELRERIKSVDADVHIAILDSCSSGSFTRLKGGIRRSPFLFDESSRASGYAFLTSSSESEAAQESDELEGSFFTHYLLAGLSGAADTSRDGKVSLNELYTFAGAETLARTERTLAGPQHPAYDINLAGTGDLVLTDLRQGGEQVVLQEEMRGRLSIRDSRGSLVLELRKHPGSPVVLSLPPGSYELILDDGTRLRGSTIRLAPGASVSVGQGDFRYLGRERTVSRGDATPSTQTGRPDREGMEINFVAVGHGSFQGMQIGMIGTVNEGPVEGIQMSGVFNIVEGKMSGPQLAGVFNITEGAMAGPQLAGVFNITEGSMDGPQLAGVFNISEGRLAGPQLAGVFNIVEGETFSGVQLAGVFNIAGSIKGSQFGVVNVAERMEGVQVGLVNISEELYGVPIGLVNISGNGLHHLSAWYDQKALAHLGLQLGTFYYTFVTAAVDPADPHRLFSAGLGMGIEMPLGPFYLDTELYARKLVSGEGSFDRNVAALFADSALPVPSLRLSFGRHFDTWKGGRSSVFAGVNLSLHIPDQTPFREEIMTGSPWKFDYSGKGDLVSIYPSWFIGMRF